MSTNKLIALFALVTSLSFGSIVRVEPTVTWTMINVNDTDKQADAHLLEFPDGKKLLVDVGYDGINVTKALRQKGIAELDCVILSHAHDDHYGGLRRILADGIKVREVRLNLPTKAMCDHDKPACNYEDLLALGKELRAKNIVVKPVSAGEKIVAGSDVSLEVLYVYDGVNTPIGSTDINDMSSILLLKTWNRRSLLTGDLNQRLGEYLAANGKNLEADILKAPHHGTEGCAPDAFFDKVNPLAVLVPAPTHLWISDRSQRIRSYFRKKKIPAYVNGLHGSVTVVFDKTRFVLTTETGRKHE